MSLRSYLATRRFNTLTPISLVGETDYSGELLKQLCVDLDWVQQV